MSLLESSHINPYQTPTECPTLSDAERSQAWIKDKIAGFRQQIHALAAVWMFIGFVWFGLGWTNLALELSSSIIGSIVCSLIAMLGLLLFAAGILAGLKSIIGVKVGLGFSYVSMVGSAALLPMSLGVILPMVFILLVILQAHRVLRWSKELMAAGIPLTAKP
jgi:hypothetical protein